MGVGIALEPRGRVVVEGAGAEGEKKERSRGRAEFRHASNVTGLSHWVQSLTLARSGETSFGAYSPSSGSFSKSVGLTQPDFVGSPFM